MEMNCEFEILVRKNEAENVKNIFENLRCVSIKQY